MDESSSGTIPEVWPPVDPIEPVKPRRVPWLLAPLATAGAMLFPRRVGPHLAASSWLSAYVAHVFSIVLCVGLFGAMAFEATGPELGVPSGLSLSEHLRRPFAAVALMLVAAAGYWPAWIGIAVGAAVIQGVVWLGAFFVMPLFSAGERPSLLYFRCVKLMLWSASALIAVGIASTLAMGWVFRSIDGVLPWYLQGPAAFDLFLLCVIWWLSVLLRLGGRYGGPKDGPRWQGAPLRCEGCGYELTGLPTDARCPECGRAISDSLPDRRSPPLFALNAGFLRRPAAFVRTVFQSWAPRRFAARLSVHRGESASRVYALANCLLIGVCSALLLLPLMLMGGEDSGYFLLQGIEFIEDGDSLIACLVFGVLAAQGAVLGCLAWLVVVAAFATRLGWRDAASRTVVICYASGWLYLPVLLTVFALYVTRIVDTPSSWNTSIQVPILGWIDPAVAVALLAHIAAVITLIHSFFRVRIMLIETRYANG
jgi:hypothetical protein